jgi:hypothetical protein
MKAGVPTAPLVILWGYFGSVVDERYSFTMEPQWFVEPFMNVVEIRYHYTNYNPEGSLA